MKLDCGKGTINCPDIRNAHREGIASAVRWCFSTTSFLVSPILFLVLFLASALSTPTAHAAITGTGDCVGIAATHTANYTCTGGVTVDAGSVLTLTGDITLTVGTLTVSGAGSSVVANATNTFTSIVAGTLTVGAGAFIDANGFGCPENAGFNITTGNGCAVIDPTNGPGYGRRSTSTNRGAGGGGHGNNGAIGGGGGAGAGGSAYGTVVFTVPWMGSGGGNGYSSTTPATGFAGSGGEGAGAIKLTVTGTATINGTIQADGVEGTTGSSGTGGGGGSGGGIYLSAATFAGNGTIQAVGGDGDDTNDDGGGGAGGRVVIEYTTADTFTGSGSYDVSGGGVRQAGKGSVFVNNKTALPNVNIFVGGNATLTDTLDGTTDGTMNFQSLGMLAVGAAGTGTVTLADDVMMTAPSQLTLNSGDSLTVNADILNNGLPVTINSGASLSMAGGNTLNAPQLDVYGTLNMIPDATTFSTPTVSVTTLNVFGTGIINANGQGCPAYWGYDVNTSACVSSSPGEGSATGSWNAGGGGGAHGGSGGRGEGDTPGAGGIAYGKISTDPSLGSGTNGGKGNGGRVGRWWRDQAHRQWYSHN